MRGETPKAAAFPPCTYSEDSLGAQVSPLKKNTNLKQEREFHFTKNFFLRKSCLNHSMQAPFRNRGGPHQAPLAYGVSQARTLQWVAMSSSKGSSRPRDQTCISVLLNRQQVLDHSCHLGSSRSTPSSGKRLSVLYPYRVAFSRRSHTQIIEDVTSGDRLLSGCLRFTRVAFMATWHSLVWVCYGLLYTHRLKDIWVVYSLG